MTFGEMTFQEKKEHIWEYYKIHMIMTAGVLLLIGSLLNIYLFNPAPDVMLDLTVRIEQKYYITEYQESLKAALIDEMVMDPESQTIMLELLATDAAMDPNSRMATEAKFMGKAELRELDIFIIDEFNFNAMLQEGYFMDLGELEEQFGIQLPEAVKVYSTDSVTQEERPFAYDAKQLVKLAPIFRGDEEINFYACIFIRSEKEETAMKALKFLSE